MTKPHKHNPLRLPRWMIDEIRKQGGDPHATARGYGFSHCEPYKPMPALPPMQLEAAAHAAAMPGALTVADWRDVVRAAAVSEAEAAMFRATPQTRKKPAPQ